MKSEEVKKIILDSFHEKNNSHAFLLVTNNVEACLNDVTDMVKKINCKKEGLDGCTCPACKSIDASTNPDYIVIKPDGKEIKKDQVMTIIDTFKTKSMINDFSMYTIVNAEKMNDSSANKLLKFLEEPEDNIIGFFITEKLQAVLPTIKSRCEVYNYRFGNNSILDLLDINEEEYSIGFDIAMNITNLLNDNIKYMLMSETKSISKRERNELDIIFNLIRKFYILKYQNVTKDLYNDLEYASRVLNSIVTTDVDLIVNRIKLIDKILEEMNYNVNKELIINKFFILWE